VAQQPQLRSQKDRLDQIQCLVLLQMTLLPLVVVGEVVQAITLEQMAVLAEAGLAVAVAVQEPLGLVTPLLLLPLKVVTVVLEGRVALIMEVAEVEAQGLLETVEAQPLVEMEEMALRHLFLDHLLLTQEGAVAEHIKAEPLEQAEQEVAVMEEQRGQTAQEPLEH
jgi:hypothetical protein